MLIGFSKSLVFSTLPNPKFVLAPLADVDPVPPLANATVPVTFAAFPVTLPTIGAVTVKFTSVPTLVKLDPVTVDFKVVPVNCSAAVAADMVISPVPSNAIPFIFLAVANFVAVAALPVVFNFKFKAACVTMLIGLFASLVLFTLPNPTIELVIPLTVPVNVGLAIGAFNANTVDTSDES